VTSLILLSVKLFAPFASLGEIECVRHRKHSNYSAVKRLGRLLVFQVWLSSVP